MEGTRYSIEEDILPVKSIFCVLLQAAITTDAVLSAEFLPEFEANYSNHARRGTRILWLPHWPTCTVTISRGMWRDGRKVMNDDNAFERNRGNNDTKSQSRTFE